MPAPIQWERERKSRENESTELHDEENGTRSAVTCWSSSKPSLHPRFHSAVAVGAHMGSATRFQMRTRWSRDRAGEALVILLGVKGGGKKALSIRNSVGLLIFNFIFCQECINACSCCQTGAGLFVSFQGSHGCSVPAFRYQRRQKWCFTEL